MRFTKTIATASVAAVLGIGGVSVAGATSTTGSPSSSTPTTSAAASPAPSTASAAVKGGFVKGLRRRIRRQAGRLAAKTIGITPAELRSELRAGKTIATIATDHGVTPQTVIDALTTAANHKIDAAVTAHKLTAARAARLKLRVDAAIPRIVDDWHPKAKAGANG